VQILGADEEQMGVLGAAANLPFLFFGLLAGVWVDHGRRRPILLGVNLSSALLLLTIPVAAMGDSLGMLQLYVVAFGVGVANVLGTAAYQAYIPGLVGRRRLVEANSRLELSASAATVLGPGLGGILVQVLTAPIAIVVDAASFLAAALGIASIRRPEPVRAPRPAVSLVRRVREGLSVIWNDPRLRLLMACGATHNFFLNGLLSAMYVLYAVDTLGLSPAALGLVYASAGPGVLVGAMLAGRLRRRLGLGRSVAHAQTLTGLSRFVVAAAALLADPLVLPVMMAGEFLLGVARPIFNVNQVSLRQEITPDELLGRMNASIRFLMWAATPIGAAVGGLIAARFGVPAAIVVGASGGLLAAAWAYRPAVLRIE
jgi:predicted MFS family arabinose efflux permease